MLDPATSAAALERTIQWGEEAVSELTWTKHPNADFVQRNKGKPVGTLLWCSVVGFRPGLGADVKLVCIIHAPDISFKEHCMTAINLYMLKKFENGLKDPIKLARQTQAVVS